MQQRSVGEIEDAMEMKQPSVQKHLKILKDVGIEARRESRQMLYKVNAIANPPLHDGRAHSSGYDRLSGCESKNGPRQG